MHQEINNSVTEDCVRIKELGYGSSRHIQMYGERYEIVSDPFPDGDAVAVFVTTANDKTRRRLRLPASILLGLKDLFPEAARP